MWGRSEEPHTALRYSRLMKRPLALALAAPLSLFFLVLALAPREARACSCVPSPPPATALERSAATFVGEVLSVEPRRARGNAVKLRVERTFKGTLAAAVTLFTPDQPAACGRNFEVGERYLVYAEQIGGALYDNLCTRTSPLASAKSDVEALDALARGEPPPAVPVPAVEEHDNEGTPPSGAAGDDGSEPAHDERPPPGQPPPEAPKEQPGGHCAALSAPSGGLFGGLLLVLGWRRRRSARRRR